MTAKLFSLPKQVILTNTAALIPGAEAFFYIKGTSTFQNTFTASDLVTPHTNPVVADADGRWAAIYLDDTLEYKVVITDGSSPGNPAAGLIYTEDDFLDALTVADLLAALTAPVLGAITDPQTPTEAAQAQTPTNFEYEAGNWKRFGATGDGVTDDTTSIQNSLNVWNTGVVTGNPEQFAPFGDYSINTTLNIGDSDSQWILSGESRARSSSVQATTAVAGLPMFLSTNMRDTEINDIEFLGIAASEPSHGWRADRDDGSQTGAGGPGKANFNRCLFRNVEIGFEPVKISGGNNDEFMFFNCTFGQGITKWGVKLTGTNSAWNMFKECRFDSVPYADISTAVIVGADRGGSFTSTGCMSVLSELCYEVGDCRNAAIIDAKCEQTTNFLRSTGKILEATDISITGNNTINSVAADLPVVAAGDMVWLRGLAVTAEDGAYRATGTPTTSAIEVTDIDGTTDTLTDEVAGGTIQVGTTKLLLATESTTCKVTGSEVITTGANPIIWDGDNDALILTLAGEFSLIGGTVICGGDATIVFGPGRYQITELIVDDGAIVLLPGAVFTAGTVTKTFWGTGRIINHGAIGGQIDDQVTWNPADLVTGTQESNTVTVSGARAGDAVQVFPGVDVEEMLVSAAVSADDTVEITLANETGGNVNLASSVWHVRAFPAN